MYYGHSKLQQAGYTDHCFTLFQESRGKMFFPMLSAAEEENKTLSTLFWSLEQEKGGRERRREKEGPASCLIPALQSHDP